MLPLLHRISDLAHYLNYPERALITLAFEVDDSVNYHRLIIPKRNGEPRIIMVPSLTLKMVQRRLLPYLEGIYRPSTRAHGYVAGRGLRSNATPHIGKRFVLNADLADFFGTIHFGRIRGRLMAAPYGLSDAVATTIARLTTYEEKLPMGAPTSPILSNMLCSGLDTALAEAAKNHGCFYTRYADDITFSTNRRNFPRALAELEIDNGHAVTIPGKELVLAIEAQGFKLNLKKTRLLSTFDRQEVCEIVCNQRLNVLPKLRRQIRASLHAWRKFGLEEAEREWNAKFNFRKAGSFEMSLRGKIEFLKHIRGEGDPVVVSYASQFNALRVNTGEINVLQVQDWRGALARTSCCIHSYQDLEMSQGSGFVVEGGYVVTNRHVVFNKAGGFFDEVNLNFPGSIIIDIPMEIVCDSSEYDLAILKPKEQAWVDLLKKEFCSLSATEAKREDVIWLTGWPNYNDGDDVHLVQGSVGGYSYPDGVKMFRITPAVVFGNSGGAVFNESGEVVGVATRGSDVADAPLNVHNGCLPIARVKDLLATIPV